MDKALATMISNMPEKTGKTLEEWNQILGKKTFFKHSEGVKYLKDEHGLTHGFANTIVSLSKDNDESPQELVDLQYKGKEVLMPIYEKLIDTVKAFGADVVITPKKSTVSLIRKKQFALIKPATKSRIDLGLKLTGKDIDGRLEGSGSFGTMCTHCVKLSEPEEVNPELVDWLKEAYNKAE